MADCVRGSLVGQTRNRLTVTSEYKERYPYGMVSKCICDCSCGRTGVVVRRGQWVSGRTKSCGCYNAQRAREGVAHARKFNTKHNLCHTREYASWRAMVSRCTNPQDPAWDNYGGRGIKVCDRWLGDEGIFAFIEDLGSRPEGKTLDREDNDGNYCKENCKWSSPLEQSQNRRNVRDYTYEGKTQCLSAWSREFNVNYRVLARHLNCMSVDMFVLFYLKGCLDRQTRESVVDTSVTDPSTSVV